MVGCTSGSRGEAPGERKPVIRNYDDNDDGGGGDDDSNNNNNRRSVRGITGLHTAETTDR